MAITNYLVHFKTKDTYDQTVVSNPLRNDAVAFIQDATIIRTHGTEYHCGSGPVALKSELATVATTGSYNDLTDLPENSKETYLLDLTSVGEIYENPSGNVGTDTYTNLVNAINNKQLVCVSMIVMTRNMNFPTTAVIYLDNSVILQCTVDNDHITVTISSNGDFTLGSKYVSIDASQIKTGVIDIARLPSITNAKITSVSASKITGTISQANLPSYLDGVTSNIQTQLNGKAASSHIHSTSDITSGTLALARIPTGTTASTVALGNHTHNTFNNNVTIGSGYNLYIDGPGSGVTLGAIDADGIDILGVQSSGDSNLVAVLTAANYTDYITTTDTKNTTGTSNSTSKLYLAGGTSQSSTGVQTYSNSAVYTQSGQLYATQMNSTNGFYETSDARLKNFKDDIKALDVVSEIPTKYFTWKKDEEVENVDPELHIGTSAQEVQKVYPDLVTKNAEGELSVDYARLSVIALAAIKELKEEINELKAKLQ